MFAVMLGNEGGVVPPSPGGKRWLNLEGEVLGKVLVKAGVVLLDCLCVSVNRHVSSQSNTSSV